MPKVKIAIIIGTTRGACFGDKNETDMLDQLVWWSSALKAARDQPVQAAA